MEKFRKKPVVVEAVQLTDAADCDWDVISKWCGGRLRNTAHGFSSADPVTYLEIPTLEGIMIASEGDWIIKGVNGEFYPCKPDIFEKTYERVIE